MRISGGEGGGLLAVATTSEQVKVFEQGSRGGPIMGRPVT